MGTLPNARNEGTTTPLRSQQGINGDRTAQLEQNMKFLQDQHQATLIALHQEVELLRQRNRGDRKIIFFLFYNINFGSESIFAGIIFYF